MGLLYKLTKKLRKANPPVTPTVSKPNTPPTLQSQPDPNATTIRPDNLWERAEHKLTENEDKRKIVQAGLEILGSQLKSNCLQPRGTASRQEQLCGLLELKTRELEEKKLTVRFLDNEVSVRDKVTKTFRNILLFKDIISPATASSPPAAIACAGVTVVLTLVLNAAEQHSNLIQGLESISGLICRLQVTEDLYRSARSQSAAEVKLQQKFEADLTDLYSMILEFQFRALCYVQKHRVTKLFRDAFDKDGWTTLMQDIEKSEDLSQSYTVLLGATNVDKRLSDIKRAQESTQEWQQQRVRDERQKSLLRLLYTCPYKDRKDRNSKRVPGTCEWFTGHSLFKDWQQNDKSCLLWVSADPGCGKSVLAKYLADDFLPSITKATVCYFFFKDDFSDQKTATNAICAVLRQLILAQPHLLSDSLLDKMETDGDKFTNSLSDLWSAFTSIAADPRAGEIICIIDALDECEESHRESIIRTVQDFFLINAGKCKVKLLITSRPYYDIRYGFQERRHMSMIHLSGEGEEEVEKIAQEINLVVEKRVDDIGNKRRLRTEQCQFLLDKLKVVPNRTYLWVTLTLDVIENILGFTKGNIDKAIKEIPQTVDEAYDKILNRGPAPDKARSLLHIVTAATRPLSVGEMSLALAIDQTWRSSASLEDHLEHEDDFRHTMRDLCGLFVVIVDSRVYLLHQTAKEFLVASGSSLTLVQPDTKSWKQSLHPAESNKALAEICTWYLHSNSFAGHPTSFLEYSIECWDAHFRLSAIQKNDAITALAQHICDPESAQYEVWSKSRKENAIMMLASTCSLLIASSIGLKAVVDLLITDRKMDIESKDSDRGWTAIFWAVKNGHIELADFLLRAGTSPHSKNRFGQTPVFYAHTHGGILQLLLDAGANVNQQDFDGNTPLKRISDDGNYEEIKLLLDAGADVNCANCFGLTPLHTAAVWNNKQVVQMLLDAGADPNVPDNDGETPLYLASTSGEFGNVETLLKGGASVNHRDDEGRTALSGVVVEWDGFTYEEDRSYLGQTVIKVLLDGGADVDTRDNDGRTPLSLAATYSDWVAASILIHAGADVNTRDDDDLTPLDYATYTSFIETLVKAGADTTS
ncbi:hypothetical protein MW887_000810 [Aspergillus wentii]|nr:hypothetical protein MW887_000810 [Aspergillus wentii]